MKEIKDIIQEEISLLNESISNIVYHRTSYNGLISILKYNKILLSSSIGTSADKTAGGMPYFLSFSRTKNPSIGYNRNPSVTIEFDGDALNTKYKGGAIDYWQWPNLTPSRRAESNEYEDRIYSNNPYMENLDRYITHIDILLNIDDRKLNKETNEYTSRSIVELQESDSPLKSKIRVFYNTKDFQTGSNWKTINDINAIKPSEESYYSSLGSFDFRLLEKVITILLVGDPKLDDDAYVSNFIKSYIDRFKEEGATNLNSVDDEKIREIRYNVRTKIYDLENDRDFLASLDASIHNLVKNSTKTPINYEVLKLLSDEMRKYKVSSYIDLIKAKKGYKVNNVFTDYSKIYSFVWQSYEGYVLADNDAETFLSWTILNQNERSKLMDLGYPVTTKSVINYLFNTYDEKRAKFIISKMIPSYSSDYIFVDLRNKTIYTELTQKDDDRNISNSSLWSYMDKNVWWKFITDNINEQGIKKLLPKLMKVLNDDDIKIGFMFSITSKLIGEEKTKQFFDDNDIVPIHDDYGRERRYIKSI